MREKDFKNALYLADKYEEILQINYVKPIVAAVEKKRAGYRAQGVCQHCGNKFKGIFTKKCTNCGKPKDY